MEGTVELVTQMWYRCIKIVLSRHRGSIHPSFQIITSCLARNPKMLNFRFDEKFHSLLKCYFWRSGRRRNVKFKSYVYFGGSRIIQNWGNIIFSNSNSFRSFLKGRNEISIWQIGKRKKERISFAQFLYQHKINQHNYITTFIFSLSLRLIHIFKIVFEIFLLFSSPRRREISSSRR